MFTKYLEIISQPLQRKPRGKQTITETDLYLKQVRPSCTHLVSEDYAVINASYFLQCDLVSLQSKDSQKS